MDNTGWSSFSTWIGLALKSRMKRAYPWQCALNIRVTSSIRLPSPVETHAHARDRRGEHVRPIRQDLQTCSTNYNDLKWDMCLYTYPIPIPPPSPFVQLGIRENDPWGKQLLSDDEKRTEAGIRRMTADRRRGQTEWKKRLPPGLPGLCLPENRIPARAFFCAGPGARTHSQTTFYKTTPSYCRVAEKDVSRI